MGLLGKLRALFGGDSATAESAAASQEHTDDEPDADDSGSSHAESASSGTESATETDTATTESTIDLVAGSADEDDETGDATTQAGAHADAGPVPEQVIDFRDEAEDFANFWSEHDLDFTLASLSRLDALVDDQWDEERFQDVSFGESGYDAEAFTGLVIRLGSYLGAVLVRNRDGVWISPDDATDDESHRDEWSVRVGDAVVPVFDVAMTSLREPASFESTVESIGASTGNADAESGTTTARAASSEATSSTFDSDEVSGDPDAFASAAAELVATWEAYELDYDPASLSALDALVDEHVPTAVDDPSTFGRRLGSYVGEVVRRTHDGEWVTDDDAWVVRVTIDDDPITVDVFALASQRLSGDPKFVDAYNALIGNAEQLGVSLPEEATTLADEWPSYDLDFSLQSITRLDAVVAAEFDAERYADVELGDRSDETSMELTTRAIMFGGYFGAVFVRNDLGRWDDSDPFGLVVELESAETSLNVVSLAANCLRGTSSFTGSFEALTGRRLDR